MRNNILNTGLSVQELIDVNQLLTEFGVEDITQVFGGLATPAKIKEEVDCGHILKNSLRMDVSPCHGGWSDWCVTGGNLPETNEIVIMDLICYPAGHFFGNPCYIVKKAIDSIQSGNEKIMDQFLEEWHKMCYKSEVSIENLGVSGLFVVSEDSKNIPDLGLEPVTVVR